MGLSLYSDGRESACNAGDLGSIPGVGRSPGEGNSYSLQYSGLENPHAQRNLAGNGPWGRKESHNLATKHSIALRLTEDPIVTGQMMDSFN